MIPTAVIPVEWLRELATDRGGYRKLLEHSGGLTEAAYQLARVKCLSWERSTEVPTKREVRAAAHEIARHVTGVRVPNIATLARDIEALGLPVL